MQNPHEFVPYRTPFFWRGGVYGNMVSQFTDQERRLFANMIEENHRNPPCRDCGAGERNPRLHF